MGTVILTYHRVAGVRSDPYLLAVEPSRLREQLELISRTAEPVSLRDVLSRSRADRVAVTFDDGYADNAIEALPLLEEASVPATVFVVSTMVGKKREFWHHRLDRLLRLAPAQERHVRLEIGGTQLTIDVGTEEGCRRAMWALHARLRPLSPDEIDRVLDALAEQLGDPGGDELRRPVNHDELRRLSASPLVTIGSHTRRHAWLASRSAAEQEDEIAGSRRDLEEMTGHGVDQFAYPYGLARSYDRRAVKILRRSGFELACTTHNEAITPLTSRFRLPRQGMRNWDAQRFEERLRAWLDQ